MVRMPIAVYRPENARPVSRPLRRKPKSPRRANTNGSSGLGHKPFSSGTVSVATPVTNNTSLYFDGGMPHHHKPPNTTPAMIQRTGHGTRYVNTNASPYSTSLVDGW